MRRLQTYQRTRTGKRMCVARRLDGVAYYTETVNSDVKVWEQDFCTTSMALYVLCMTIILMNKNP